MFEDRYGLPVTTTSHEAFGLFTDALDLALAGRGGAMPLLEQATVADEDFALAWALLGLLIRVEGKIKAGTALVERAFALSDALTAREQGQLAMLDAFCHGRFEDAEARADAHLAKWPADAVVQMQANHLFNLLSTDLDRRQRNHDLSQRTLAQSPDDWYFLGQAAFAASEVAEYEASRDYAARSFAANPHNADAAHATAHTFLETGAIAEGAAWLESWLRNWDTPSTFACHLRWHVAYFAIADGRAEEVDPSGVLAFHDNFVSVLMDSASLLWRLRLAGVEDLPWTAIADLPSGPGYSLSNFHRAFVLAALGDFDGLSEWCGRLRGVAAVVSYAIGAHARGDFAHAATTLESVEPDWVRLGGSRAQLEVIDDTLIDALARVGRRADAVARLDARLARRETKRDRAWWNRLR
jgi:hypothetical protein